MDKFQALKTYFGYDSFRSGQQEIIDRLLGGDIPGGDVLAVMPTGAGKSVCYQLPALMMTGVIIVISPLISLMKDQVRALLAVGVRAAYINGSLTPTQCEKALKNASEGMYKIIYVAPERLGSREFLQMCARVAVPFVAVDEAHCVSQWGQDFRPSYLKIADFIESFPIRPIVGAFTATATAAVKEDIIKKLRLQEPLCITTGFDRPNLYFEVQRPEDKDLALLRLLKARGGSSGIVYCGTRRGVDEVCDMLNSKGISACRYHAGLDTEQRQKSQEDFIYDRKRVMVATNAFGMGIDKSNVSFVIHYNMPKNLESYYQEAGRAGRDGAPADCILLYSASDVKLAEYLIKNTEPNPELTAEERAAVTEADKKRLAEMRGYCFTKGCLRTYILKYFGEKSTPCGNCSICKSKPAEKKKPAERKKSPPRKEEPMYGGYYPDGRAPASVTKKEPPVDYDLLRELKALRSRIAADDGMPAYVVFSDETLLHMCRMKPVTQADFLAVPGVGVIKAKRYYIPFYEVIVKHTKR